MLEVNKIRDELENILKALEKRGISDIENKLQGLIEPVSYTHLRAHET